MNAVVLAALGLAAFFLATRTYARFIERRVLDADTDEPTPAHTHTDGVDFVPCGRHVLFGHHFCSVAGAAPIVGPAIAVIWGWLPAFLWVVLGTVFIGAVHDFGALALSAKREGRTMGDIAGDLLGPRARVWFLSIIVLLTWVVLAAFAYIIGFLFWAFPASVWPVNLEILLAVGIGLWIYKGKGSLLVPSLVALAILYVSVFLFAQQPELGSLSTITGMDLDQGQSIVVWIAFLLVYAFIASVLPVRVLLQPRDFINSHQLFLGLGALLVGLAWVHPEVTAPAINPHAADAGAPSMLPLLFITIACGAISGFHGLVASGTTSKQLDRMCDARHVGYGGMVGEGLLAMIAVLAVSAGLGTTAEWHERYSDWKAVGNGGIGSFVEGASTFLSPLLAGNVDLAQTVVAVIVISFAATTLDTATRIQRFCLAELGGGLGLSALRNRFVGAAVAVIPAGVLAIATDGGKGPGSGGFVLWPIFGTTNQLIGGITLLLLSIHVARSKRPVWPIVLPMAFLVVMTTWAGVQNLWQVLESPSPWKQWPVIVFGFLFLALEAAVLIEAAIRWRRGRLLA